MKYTIKQEAREDILPTELPQIQYATVRGVLVGCSTANDNVYIHIHNTIDLNGAPFLSDIRTQYIGHTDPTPLLDEPIDVQLELNTPSFRILRAVSIGSLSAPVKAKYCRLLRNIPFFMNFYKKTG